ncbi:MAG TPA: M1 family metallopeptidase [Chitinophagales bacterium]|nr:M1 family metallopeptidase [Chitinophagales bacterium]
MTQTFLAVAANDPHSFAQAHQAVVKHLNLELYVDFGRKVLAGKAIWTIEQHENATEIVFDTRGLNIRAVAVDGNVAKYKLDDDKPFLGQALRIELPKGTKSVGIEYVTSPDAAAVQWLEPEQTEGKKHPFLFTQSQAILARTWLPCQDSPGIRFTYDAKVTVPKELLAVMSASNPQKKNETGIYSFKMTQPIPSYLMALAVGDIAFESVGKRSGIYAEPKMLERAVYEFAETEKMIDTAEQLYGPYRWEQYDVLVLPPSFPFGGMENPRLTFATPTVIAGDRSMVALVAHELAHSWSGNLVTNATWNDFWLNEGFTVYFERRIMEKIYDKSFADMEASLGLSELHALVEEMGDTSRDTQLKLELDARDPDDGMTPIAYEKGYALLLLIERKVGRAAFDKFINDYFHKFAFKTMTTEAFVDYLNDQLLSKHPDHGIDLNEWIYKPGLPADAPTVESERFALVDTELKRFVTGTPAKDLAAQKWSTHEWLRFLRGMPDNLSMDRIKDLDDAFKLTHSTNSEIADQWFLTALKYNYAYAYTAMEQFLINVGRRKFLMPLYKQMVKTPEGKEMAKRIFEKAKGNYHSVSRVSVQELLDGKSN